MPNENAQILVEASGLRKEYGSACAVESMTFKVSRGEVVGFLGPNGAGKSTTMKMITGFLRPTQGTACIAGVNVAENPLIAQEKLGYLPESAPMYDDMMVLDFLHFVAKLRGVSRLDAQRRLKSICERCGVMNVLGKDIGQLSKGYRQRVGLAQTLVHDPDLLILDEPTSGLDPNQIVEIRELIRDLGQEKTVILSTHILPEVQATCDRVMIINKGRLIEDDRLDSLMERQAGAVIRLIVKGRKDEELERDKVHHVLSTIPGVREVSIRDSEGGVTLGFNLLTHSATDPRESVFKAAISHDFVLLDMHRERVSLEHTFRRLTQHEERGLDA